MYSHCTINILSSDQVFQNRIRNNFDNLYRPELVKNRTLKSSGAAKGAGLEFFSLYKKFFVFDFEFGPQMGKIKQ